MINTGFHIVFMFIFIPSQSKKESKRQNCRNVYRFSKRHFKQSVHLGDSARRSGPDLASALHSRHRRKGDGSQGRNSVVSSCLIVILLMYLINFIAFSTIYFSFSLSFSKCISGIINVFFLDFQYYYLTVFRVITS